VTGNWPGAYPRRVSQPTRTADADLLAGYVAVIRELHGDNAGPGDGEPWRPRLVQGQFHDVVLSRDVVYRFPKDEDSRTRLAGRTAMLAALARLPLPVAVPEPVDAGQAGLPLGRSHVVLRRLPGEPLGARRAAQAATVVAAHLAALLDALLAAGASPELAGRVPRAEPDQWHQFATDVGRVLFPLMSAGGRQQATAELQAVLQIDPVGDALVHEDLGGDNLRWDLAGPQPRLTGVLDWDGASLGSQSADLASLAATYGWQIAEEVAGLRPGADRADLGRARAIMATFALQQALPAALSGDKAMLDDGLISYRS
jgi:aminoglycoside phosphotransferase (APT) family kinase protein